MSWFKDPDTGKEVLWQCATGPTCEPYEPDGTADGFSTCQGCNNDVWVGIIESR